MEPKNEEIFGTFVLLNSQDASFKENLVHKSGQSATAARQSFKEKSETQIKSRDIRDLFKRGDNEYTEEDRKEKKIWKSSTLIRFLLDFVHHCSKMIHKINS